MGGQVWSRRRKGASIQFQKILKSCLTLEGLAKIVGAKPKPLDRVSAQRERKERLTMLHLHVLYLICDVFSSCYVWFLPQDDQERKNLQQQCRKKLGHSVIEPPVPSTDEGLFLAFSFPKPVVCLIDSISCCFCSQWLCPAFMSVLSFDLIYPMKSSTLFKTVKLFWGHGN